jgi:hypothetical protein
MGLTLGLEFGRFQAVARSGQNSLDQGLPWVSRMKGLETPTRSGQRFRADYRRISWPLQG